MCIVGASLYGHSTKSCTIHKWCGLEDGRHQNEDLVHLIKTDERFENAKRNITETDCLIIDEVSMVSKRTLAQIEFVCRSVRNSNSFFGGLQVVLVGDFYQLQPVRNEIYGDFGHPCFLANWFDDAFPHVINLKIIHRQEETNLILAVNEMELGQPSSTTIAFLNSLSRPLTPERNQSAVYLFARNIDVMLFNHNKLKSVVGDLQTFKSEDSGDVKMCDQFLAPKFLGVKIGCPVMLLINLTDYLVNGKIGTVKLIEDDYIHVAFSLFGEIRTVKISKFTFSKFDPVAKSTIATRRQFPLNLAYAFTIHKSQGMTIENLVVDCSNATFPGQLGVAIGRAKSIDGLCVQNFRPSLCRPHPTAVEHFYLHCRCGEFKDDYACCKRSNGHERDEGRIQDDDDDSNDDGEEKDEDGCEDHGFQVDESDLSDLELDIIKEIEVQERNVNKTQELEEILSYIMEEFEDTPLSKSAGDLQNEILLSPTPFIACFHKHKTEVENIGSKVFPTEKSKFSQSDFRNFHTQFNKYISSDEYRNSTQQVCDSYHSRQLLYRFITTSMFKVQRDVLKEVAEREVKEIPAVLKKISTDKPVSGPGRGKIRYIGGYVIAKLKYRNSRIVRRSAFAPGKGDVMEECERRKNLLNSLCSSEMDLIDSTTDPESLIETKRKQNVSGSLCNIQDDTFEFFRDLELKSRELLTYEKLVETKSKFYEVVEKLLLEDTQSKSLFANLLRKFTDEDSDHEMPEVVPFCDHCKSCKTMDCLYTELVRLFIKVSINQFRKDFLTALSVEKSKALRQKVREREVKKEKHFDVKTFQHDNSDNKIASHLRLKSEIMRQPDALETKCTKAQLLELCNAYGVKISKSKKKAEINQALVEAVLKADSIQNPDAFASTFTDKRKRCSANEPRIPSITEGKANF